MTPQEFNRFAQEIQAEALALLVKKNADYSASDEQGGPAMYFADAGPGDPPQKVWWYHMTKGLGAVRRWVFFSKVESEPVRSRFVDLMNYAVLGAALAHEIVERRKKETPRARRPRSKDAADDADDS